LARALFTTLRGTAKNPQSVDWLIGWVDGLLATIAKSEVEVPPSPATTPRIDGAAIDRKDAWRSRLEARPAQPARRSEPLVALINWAARRPHLEQPVRSLGDAASDQRARNWHASCLNGEDTRAE
jgi:hypothetical protein